MYRLETGPRPLTVLKRARQGLVVAKHRHGSFGPTATEIEAEWLNAARHGPVVKLDHVAPTRSLVQTRLAGTASLRTLTIGTSPCGRNNKPKALASIAQLSSLLPQLAFAVEQLHQAGLAHGQITLEHAIVTGVERDRIVLCSPNTDPSQKITSGTDSQALAKVIADLVPLVTSINRSQGARWKDLADKAILDQGSMNARQFGTELANLNRSRRWLPFR